MTNAHSEILQAVADTVLPLLHVMDLLAWARQRVDPYGMAPLVQAIEGPEAGLAASLAPFRQADWPDALAAFRDAIDGAAGDALAAMDGLKAAAAADGFDALRVARRALRQHRAAEQALYPLAALSPPISQYFLSHDRREAPDVLARLDAAADAGNGHGGLIEAPGPTGGARGGHAAYIPEYLDPSTPAPVVLALHGGRGNGPDFLWSWLPGARARGVVLIAPTALGETWAIMGDDVDSPNLLRILDAVAAEGQALDRSRVLLTGMSDGGTFAYVAGLLDGGPATALAPFAASFHPMLLEFASPARLRSLPVRLTHGARDWMFPVDVARTAAAAFREAQAPVIYRELADRAHVFPEDEVGPTLDWFLGLN
jgi:phospholipase/carboxylesterase